jgi:predicted flap endonuclease-1-like 5' DNA nuclease
MASKEPRRRRRGLVILVLALLVAAGAATFRMLRRRPVEDLPARYGPGAGDPAPGPQPPVARPRPLVPTTPAPDPPADPTPPAGDVSAVDRPPASAPATAGDDLVVIDGIGPKIAAALAAGGIATFAALAETSPERLREILAEHGLRFAPNLETWPAQARARLA